MDNLMLDQMLPEYQEQREEVVHELAQLHQVHDNQQDTSSSSHEQDRDSSSPSSDLSNEPTIPVSDLEPGPGLATRAENNPPASMDSTSSTSSSSDFSRQSSSSGSTSLYQAGFTAPTITYERDNELQKLIAVIGREFDHPNETALSLQKITAKQPNCDVPVAKFVPFTLKRKMLLRGSFDNRELRQHDLVCMCYNASEARILLTGPDGFYTSLLKYVEACLGPNKVSFLISNYSNARDISGQDTTNKFLIFPSLKTRLYNQEPLRSYLDNDHVMSWSDEPNELQARRLLELANMELNPQSLFGNASCCLL